MKPTRRAFIAGSAASLATTAAHAQSQVVYQCGVVEMRPRPDGSVGIYGWQDLVPNSEPVISPRHDSRFVITSSFADKVLEVHERDARGYYHPRAIWPVVTPEPSELPGTVDGSVYRIDTRPDWNPSSSLRRKYETYRRDHPEEYLPPLPGGTVPYGHPANPMGQRKIRADWRGRYMASAVLHGTSGYPVEFCNAETSGCVRLHDQWIITLVDQVLGGVDRALSDGVECIFTPQRIARRA